MDCTSVGIMVFMSPLALATSSNLSLVLLSRFVSLPCALPGATAFGRLLANVPAASLAQRIGRRPLIVAGPCISAVNEKGRRGVSQHEIN